MADKTFSYKLYIGIDPGLGGSVAVIDNRDNSIRFYDTPTLELKKGKKIKHEYEVPSMVNIVNDLTMLAFKSEIIVGLEKIHSMPGQGVVSMFSMGYGYGLWLGILSSLKIAMVLVPPQRWKKIMMMGMDKEKDASRLKAMQMFPQISDQLNLKKHHNRADALLIAEFVRRTYTL